MTLISGRHEKICQRKSGCFAEGLRRESECLTFDHNHSHSHENVVELIRRHPGYHSNM